MLLYFLHILFYAQFLLHGCNALVSESAGIDVIKIGQVGIHVESKPVHGYAPADPNPDRTYFPGIFSVPRPAILPWRGPCVKP